MIGGLHNPTVPDFPNKLKIAGVRWVMPGWYVYGGVDNFVYSGYLYYQPIFVSETTTYIRIGIVVAVAGAAGTLARLGIYRWTNGLPGALILDAGTVSLAAIATVEIVINQILGRGYYFLALVADDANAKCFTPDPTLSVSPPVSGLHFNNERPRNPMFYLTGRVGDVVGGLPNPAPAPTIHATVIFAYLRLREQ